MKDEGGPLGTALQEEVSNHSKVLQSKAVVLSVGEKAIFKWSGVNPGVERKRTADDAS